MSTTTHGDVHFESTAVSHVETPTSRIVSWDTFDEILKAQGLPEEFTGKMVLDLHRDQESA